MNTELKKRLGRVAGVDRSLQQSDEMKSVADHSRLARLSVKLCAVVWALALRVLTAVLSATVVLGAILVWQVRDGHLELEMIRPYLLMQ